MSAIHALPIVPLPVPELAPAKKLAKLAESEIKTAWQTYQKVEKYGLEFGATVYKWREKFKAQGSRKGLGLLPILEKVGIPSSTAYWWINRYEVSIGLREPGPPQEIPRSRHTGNLG